MKKLEITKIDPLTNEAETLTLLDEYGWYEEKWDTLQTIMNQAEPSQWIHIDYGQSSVLLRKAEIMYIVEEDAHV